MTLGFSTQINGKPNYFIEKIWKYFLDKSSPMFPYWMNGWEDKLGISIRDCYDYKPKLHTIREDKNDRWKAGNDIHMVINNRTKNRFQFAPVVKCVSVQEFEIEHQDHRLAQNPNFTYCVLKIDGVSKSREEVTELAINDGFDSVEDFFAYFNKDFKGKIIHWTDLKY